MRPHAKRPALVLEHLRHQFTRTVAAATMPTAVTAMEKRQQRLVGRELTKMEVARRIGYCLYCAAMNAGSEGSRAMGRRIAVLFVRNRQRTGSELSPSLADLMLRTLVGEGSATSETLA